MHFAADMRPPVARPARVATSLSAFEDVFSNARPHEVLARPTKVALLDGSLRALRESTVNSMICLVNRSIDHLSLSCFGKSTYSPILRMRSGMAEKTPIGWDNEFTTKPSPPFGRQ